MSQSKMPNDVPRNEGVEKVSAAHDLMTKTVLAIIDRKLGYPNPAMPPAKLARSLEGMPQGTTFGLQRASLRMEFSGHGNSEKIAVIELTLERGGGEGDEKEFLPLEIYCPLFPSKNSENQEPVIRVKGEMLKMNDRGPGKGEYARLIFSEAADVIHNLHIADTVNDKAETDASFAPVREALEKINIGLRQVLDFEEGEQN